MRWYLVERYLPGVTSQQLGEMLRVVREAAASLGRGGRPIRYVGSLRIPTDEACLCLFQSDSVALVGEANERAGARFDRIVEVHPGFVGGASRLTPLT